MPRTRSSAVYARRALAMQWSAASADRRRDITAAILATRACWCSMGYVRIVADAAATERASARWIMWSPMILLAAGRSVLMEAPSRLEQAALQVLRIGESMLST